MLHISGEARDATPYPRLVDYVYIQPKTKYPAIGSGKIKRRFVYRAISIATLVSLADRGFTRYFHGGSPGIQINND